MVDLWEWIAGKKIECYHSVPDAYSWLDGYQNDALLMQHPVNLTVTNVMIYYVCLTTH